MFRMIGARFSPGAHEDSEELVGAAGVFHADWRTLDMLAALEQNFKSSGGEMAIVRKRAGQSESAHYDEGYVVDDSGVTGVAAVVSGPGKGPVGGGGLDDAATRRKRFSPLFDSRTKRSPCRGIATLK